MWYLKLNQRRITTKAWQLAQYLLNSHTFDPNVQVQNFSFVTNVNLSSFTYSVSVSNIL